MAGLQQIPHRVPSRWDPVWFERFIRDVLALADTRNAIAGSGITITGAPNEPATIAADADLTNLLAQTFVVAASSGLLTNERVLSGESGVVEIDDNGAGNTIDIQLVWSGVPLGKLQDVDAISIVGRQFDSAGPVASIAGSAEGEVLRIQDVGGSLELGFSPLAANPTAQVGLAAVNGTSIFAMRADAAPALDQGIAPTWTGLHKFSNALTGIEIESTAPRVLIDDTDAGTGQRMIQLDAGGLRTRSDADASRTDILAWTRNSSADVTGVTIGASGITTALTLYGVATTFRTSAGGTRHVAFDNTGFTVFGQKTMRVENAAGDDAIEMSCLTGDISYITTFLTDLYIGTSLALIVKQAGNVQLAADSIELQIGAATDGDLRLSHNGTNSIIRNDTGNLLLQAGTTEVARIAGATPRFQVLDGLVGSPGYGFINDTDCGLYRVGTNNIAVATAGVLAIDIDSSQRSGFSRAPVSGWRITAAGAAGVGAVLLEDTGVADGARPFGWLRSNAGRVEIGHSNRSGTSTTGSTVRAVVTSDGGFGLVDGITAPTTAAGFALLYVDSADGDLKVKFGDGTVKTIATDT